MKIADIRNAWQAEGMHVATLPANETVDDRAMLAYYDSYPGHKHYDELRQPCRFDRYVLLNHDGKFIIIPMNPSIYTVTED